jgi:excisionase family DNA binding protein
LMVLAKGISTMAESQERLLIDIHELSALTGIAVGTLYHWVSQGRIPCVRLSLRCVRFSVPAIKEWLADLNQAPTGDNARRQKSQPWSR